jgi:hypothetical protein
MIRFLISDSSKNSSRELELPNFSEAQRSDLREFLECAKRLNECTFAQDWSVLSKISIQFGGKAGGIKNVGAVPPDEQIEVFLHRLRPIYLNNERTNFNKISNLVSSHIRDPEIAQSFRSWKREYDGSASQEAFKMSVDLTTLNSQEFLDNYLNALEYHRDKERREKIQQVTQHYPLDVQKPIIVLLLFFRLSAINRLASFIELCFDSENGKQIKAEFPPATPDA